MPKIINTGHVVSGNSASGTAVGAIGVSTDTYPIDKPKPTAGGGGTK
jgi:hypothetical protein